MIAATLGLLTLGVWTYLLLARGGFWRADQTDAETPPAPAVWPAVTAVVPARNEADVIARSVGSLLAQDYPGPFEIIVVDDDSADGTAAAATALAGAADARRLTVLRGQPLAAGWTGKLWAMSQGIAAAGDAPKYLWLTDADIAHDPDNLRRLVSRAEAGDLTLASLMADLHCETFAERLLIPAFVLFFQMVYPFRWVNRPAHRLAGAAGGCMLAQREALARSGGVAAIRTAVIDDCALAANLKRQGPIWLGLTRRARSLRPYASVGVIGQMIARSAYAQLDYSPLKLAGTVLGLGLTYLAPPALTLFGDGLARWAGLAAWAAMALAFQPMLRAYRRSPLWGIVLPLIAALYGAFTLRSAIDVWRGRGGQWKGRAQALARAS
ncbi:glycosyltransferase [Phenylobacterium sp.]|jgi:hopene-associated glycosyltransferase HpnB|uniref:glycosyltransferase n=1 Tax=Phenylobacterium sp. TaxID=1871053 RepID=UPI002E334E7C|nr:glycosyltransferase [Phenylobacterium sp.]HEX3367566.1 glycosyltransferase [Phenylobacterium sp.]